MQCAIVRELDSLELVLRQQGNLNCTVIPGLDLRKADIDWKNVQCEGAIFLGCQFPDEISVTDLWSKGALIFPDFKGLPFQPYRPNLYSREELMEGWSEEADHSLDKRIYDHFVAKGRHDPDVVEALAERLHDHAIDDALRDLLEGRIEQDGRKKVIGIMGGHGTGRNDPYYRKVAHLARRLTSEGYFIATGGGPGMMEAGNLGAYLSDLSQVEMDRIIDHLATAPFYTSPGYIERANEIIEQHPVGHSSLAVPTWFYGHEPTNLFSIHIAKYFSNSIREDGLLAIATHGVIFSPGSAGTTQEIFMDATHNHYASLGQIEPMVFLGRKRYEEDTMLFPCISQLAKGRAYEKMLFLTDDEDEAVNFIISHPPEPSLGGTFG